MVHLFAYLAITIVCVVRIHLFRVSISFLFEDVYWFYYLKSLFRCVPIRLIVLDLSIHLLSPSVLNLLISHSLMCVVCILYAQAAYLPSASFAQA